MNGFAQWAARWIVPILLVALVPIGVAAYTWDHQQKLRVYNSAIRACERGNTLRGRINTKFEVYDKAFSEAGAALKNSKTTAGQKLYDVLSTAAATAPGALPLTVCANEYDRPRWFWQ